MDKLPDNTIARVAISRHPETGLIAIESSHPLPRLRTFIDGFSMAEKRLIKQYEGLPLEHQINRCSELIPFQKWSDLILAAILLRERNKLGTVSESNLGANNVCFMAVGDTIYEMAPVRVIPPSKAFINTRNLLLAEVHLKADSLVHQANIEAATIVGDANLNAAAITSSAARLKREAEHILAVAKIEGEKIPPTWLVDLHVPIKLDELNRWEIGLQVNVVIKSFVYEYEKRGLHQRGTWLAEPMEPFATHMWLPVQQDGSYSITSLRMDASSPVLPHISRDSACLSIDGLPITVKSSYSLDNLSYAIEKNVTVVQLNSLYVGRGNWLPTFQEIIPKELFDALNSDEWATNLMQLTLEQGEAAHVNAALEASQTWTAPTHYPVPEPISLDNEVSTSPFPAA